MEDKIQLTLRTATRDRKASISAPGDVTIEELLNSAMQQWNLSSDYEYVIRSERLGAQLAVDNTLHQAGILDQDVLEIQPLADAG